ncbi:MAG: 50S ribosomal protein L29 [Candidatus Schekmanbacteria bacterium]|nr:50S ribosomal protein L29 [Candidatus Schekmanbacteria bacterium]
MKTSKVHELTIDELKQQEQDIYKELVNLRVQKSVGQLENPCRIPNMRRQLARVKTVLRAKSVSSQA